MIFTGLQIGWRSRVSVLYVGTPGGSSRTDFDQGDKFFYSQFRFIRKDTRGPCLYAPWVISGDP